MALDPWNEIRRLQKQIASLVTAAAAVVKAGSAFECLRVGNTGSHTAGSWS